MDSTLSCRSRCVIQVGVLHYSCTKAASLPPGMCYILHVVAAAYSLILFLSLNAINLLGMSVLTSIHLKLFSCLGQEL